jgi:ubiquinone/menaquinone biosynthesis C-methylase UbiE
MHGHGSAGGLDHQLALVNVGQERLEYFREQYDRGKSEVSKRVEQLALGQDVGSNGYTTVAQAQRLSEALEHSTDSLLLDLGAGRGWPGTYLGWSSGCRFVLSDLPAEALQQALVYAEAREVSSQVSAVRADGIALPFAPHSFDAVVHSDVLC